MMDIQHSQVLKPGEKPDAVKIDVGGITFLVNLHSGVVTIDGAEHVTATAGDSNTMEVHACPDIKKILSDIEGKLQESLPFPFDLGGSVDEFLRAPGLGGFRFAQYPPRHS